MKLSLRECARAIPEVDLRSGVRQTLMSAPAGATTAAFPYPSLRAMMRACKWPAGLRYVGKKPDDIDPGDWTEAVNGVLVDDAFWYIVAARHFCQVPISQPISKANPPRFDLGWGHGGGASLIGDVAYVAVHGESGDGGIWAVRPHAVSADLDDPKQWPTVLDRFLMPGSGLLPWVAIHPRRPLLYWTNFEAGARDQLQIWSFSPVPSLNAQPLGKMTLVTEKGDPMDFQRIQGGRVTPNNHLLLVEDLPTDHATAGIHLFDLQTGRRRWHVRFRDFDHFGPWGEIQDECQGIFVHDFGPDGLVHVNIVNKDWDTTERIDNFSLLNYEVEPVLERDLL